MVSCQSIAKYIDEDRVRLIGLVFRNVVTCGCPPCCMCCMRASEYMVIIFKFLGTGRTFVREVMVVPVSNVACWAYGVQMFNDCSPLIMILGYYVPK